MRALTAATLVVATLAGAGGAALAFDTVHRPTTSSFAARSVTLDDVPDVQVRWADCPEPSVLRKGACVRTETTVRLPRFTPPPPPPAPVKVRVVVKKKTTTTHRHHEEEEGEEGEHEGGEH